MLRRAWILLIALAPAAPAAASPAPVANELRAAARSGSLEAVVAAAAPASAPRSARPAADAAARLPRSVPPEVAALWRAVVAAEAEVSAAIRDPAAVRAALRAPRPLLRDGAGAPRLDPRVAAAARALDRGAMNGAAAGLAAAVDRLLADPPAARAGGAGAACDVAEVPGVLCVGGSGANAHAGHFRLLVDLGGDDVYTGSAGAGSCVGAPPEYTDCVSLAVDLGGRDRYEPGRDLPTCRAIAQFPAAGTCGLGSGVAGLGMLVDAGEADDVYTTRLNVDEGEHCFGGNFHICGVSTTQGAGRFGVGVLADLGGDDAYTLEAPVPAADDPIGDRSLTVDGQGVGILGTGLLWDAGGDDAYLVDGPASGYLTPELQASGWSSYSGQGVAVGGTGAIVDPGGADTFRITVRPGPGAERRTRLSPWGEGVSVSPVIGQGWGYGLSGAPTFGGIVGGAGPTVYEIDAVARFKAVAEGHGNGPGGVLDDAGGADVYRLAAVTDGTLQRACADCAVRVGAPLHPFASFSVGVATVGGQGQLDGRLRDAGGDDRYTASAVVRLAAQAADGAAGLSRLGQVRVSAQGAGGRLLDQAGDDVYDLSAEQRLRATGRGAAEASAIGLTVIGQGNGGVLSDRGGRDTYRVRANAGTAAQPEAAGGLDDGRHVVDVQGLGEHGSLLEDSDDGQPDRFLADAPGVFTPCNGRHGEAPGWAGGRQRLIGATGQPQCSSTGGRAAVSSAAALPAPATLELAAQPRSGEAAVAFTLRLTDAAGAPLAGRRVRVQPEYLLGVPYYVIGPLFEWQPANSGRQVVTDGDGRAAGTVPLPPCPQAALPCIPPRLSASFFGDETAAPAQRFAGPA